VAAGIVSTAAGITAFGSVTAKAQAPGRLTLQEALTLIDAGQKDTVAKIVRLSFAVVDARGSHCARAETAFAWPSPRSICDRLIVWTC